jgi:hypothetical protein
MSDALVVRNDAGGSLESGGKETVTPFSKAESAIRLALIKVLRSAFCPVCGKPKAENQCFCRTCYFALPQPLRNLLYTPIDTDGEFEDHYMKAMRDLKRRGFMRPLKKWTARAREAFAATGLREAMKEMEVEP